jgi:PTH1 family peptidyl-tRNA hydrolase
VKLVVGLGNPGAEYEGSPHNAGFAVVDELARRAGAGFRGSSRFRAAVARGALAGEPVALMKPLTFMNASGEAVGTWLRWHRMDVSDLVVVVDDADLEPGRLRIRLKGSSGGHKGLESVILHAGTDVFVRVRIGVGRGAGDQDMISHVLRPLGGEERERAAEAVARAAEAVEAILKLGVERAMSRYNAVAGTDEKAE